MRLATTVIVASVALAVIGEGEARACSCAWPQLGAGRLYLGADGSLPPGARGFAWAGAERLTGSSDRVSVVRVEGRRKVPVKHTIAEEQGIDLIVPAENFKPGQVYEVTVREGPLASDMRRARKDKDALPPAEATTTVTIAAAPLELTQATLRAGAPTEQSLSIAAPAICIEGITAAAVPLRVELPPEVEPLRGSLLFTTRVDGRPWAPRHSLCEPVEPGRAWTDEPGTDLVFTVCQRSPAAEQIARGQGATPPGLTPGLHRVEIEVATPDRRAVVTTPAIDVSLACPTAPTEVTPAAGSSTEPSASEPPAPASPREPPPVASRGCAVGEPGLAWLLVAAGLRRRRRASSPKHVEKDMSFSTCPSSSEPRQRRA
ncbi:hypothetical protein SAMN02745121_01093 [Nannocystis exedens]|uniref:MYXO-CTERM domain-containing protein n=1 Tax=Nannocystis exedens TaxID=54 RepID=A0A1I1UIE1_9BACT|nr:hypothetical protein [Nannocystis exedens]PCC71548.1 hypothetical protein NAEX_04625 [Nannocystis exedens]SFD67710.1 hypothetical protein SAMN02745121_01093 [Nannocystis exedens]